MRLSILTLCFVCCIFAATIPTLLKAQVDPLCDEGQKQNLVEEFYRLSESKSLDAAEKMIEGLKDSPYLEEIFYTEVIDKYGRKGNFLFNYCGKYSSPKVDFFKKALSHISDVNLIRNERGETVLNYLITTEGSSSCVEALLQSGARVDVKSNNGNDALMEALVSGKKANRNRRKNNEDFGVIIDFVFESKAPELVLAHAKKHPDQVSSEAAIFLKVYDGKKVDTEILSPILLKNLYRIANQANNLEMTQKLYQQLELGDRFAALKDNSVSADLFNKTGLFPLLWTFNITQLQAYAISLEKHLRQYYLDESKLRPIPGKPDFFHYDVDGNDLTLWRKKIGDGDAIGRVLGAEFIKSIIDKNNFKGVAVPRKFLLPPKTKDVKVRIDLPELLCDRTGGAETCSVLGPTEGSETRVFFANYALFVEYIDLGENMAAPISKYARSLEAGSRLSEGGSISEAYEIIKQARIFDIGANNVSRSKSDGKIYVIDTSTDKNFGSTSSQRDRKVMGEIQSMTYGPQFRHIDFDIKRD